VLKCASWKRAWSREHGEDKRWLETAVPGGRIAGVAGVAEVAGDRRLPVGRQVSAGKEELKGVEMISVWLRYRIAELF